MGQDVMSNTNSLSGMWHSVTSDDGGDLAMLRVVGLAKEIFVIILNHGACAGFVAVRLTRAPTTDKADLISADSVEKGFFYWKHFV